MNDLREKLIEEFYDFNVHADITIESLADVVMDVIQGMYINENSDVYLDMN